MTEEPGTEKNLSRGLIKAFVVVIIIGAIIFGIVKAVNCANSPNNPDGNFSFKSRSARNTDISVTCNDFSIEEILSLSMVFTVVPNQDIEDLEITIYFCDSSETELTSKTQRIGNLNKNQTCDASFSLTEFTLTQLYKIKAWRYEVTGGTVNYFG